MGLMKNVCLAIAIIMLSSCSSAERKFIIKDPKECQCPFDSTGTEYDIECCPGGIWYKYRQKEALRK